MGVTQSRLQQEHPFPGDTDPKYRYDYIPLNALNGWAAALVGSGAGAPIIGSGGTGLLSGLAIGADADSFVGLIGLKDDVDVNAPIDFRIIWSSDQASADTYTWTMTYGELLLETTSADVLAALTLDTAIAQDTGVATASILQATPWGTINGGKLTGTIADGYLLNVALTATTNGGTISSDLVIWYGVQIRYMPRKV